MKNEREIIKISKQTTRYRFSGKNTLGLKLAGEIEASSLLLARVILRKKGIRNAQIRVKRPDVGYLFAGRIKQQTIATFIRQLATLLKSGIALVQAVELIAKGEKKPRFAKLLLSIKTQLQSGSSLVASLQQFPLQFNLLACNLVNAGEQSGTLDVILANLASYEEKNARLRSMFKKALLYPCLVAFIACCCTLSLLVFVVPQFATLYKNFGASLPTSTQYLLEFANCLQHNGLFLTLITGSLCLGIKALSKKFPAHWETCCFNLPVMGSLWEKRAIAGFSRTLALTFAAGLPLVQALELTSGTTGSRRYYQATKWIIQQISLGQSLHSVMQESGIFPLEILKMIEIGEETGTLDQMLLKAAENYEEEIERVIASLDTILEPLILAILGLVVGAIVVLMYLPMFNLGGIL